MRPQIAFIHQNFPSQFGPVCKFLIENHDVDVAFFSETISKPILPGLRHISYKKATTGHEDNPYFFSRHFEQEVSSMHGVLNALKTARIAPDVLVGHTAFGNLGLLHVEYPEVPRIGFFELFYNPFDKDSMRPEYVAPKPNRLRIPLRNATQLVELEYCTKGYSPTAFQRSTYPSEYQKKLSVLFDGVDVQFYCPGKPEPNSALKRTWPAGAKIVTYVSRGLEAMRGFDIFMHVAHEVAQRDPDVHFVIAGDTKTHYGSEMIGIKDATFKEHVLKQRNFDLSRFHFVDWLSESALRDLFRISDCHFYWTVPFTLSWSLFQSMASGCLVVASNSAPVRDAIVDNVNGVLVDPYDKAAMVEKILDVVASRERFKHLRENARQTIVDCFSFEVCLPKLADFILGDEKHANARNSGELTSSFAPGLLALSTV
jgi:glycosyltransferase involved in cell wall biosynthesis